MDRRKFICDAVSGLLGALVIVSAQAQPVRVYRIGVLGAETASYDARRVEILRTGLRELGYVEGKNLVIVTRHAEGDYSRLPGMAEELVRLDVDVIVASGSKAGIAAKGATSTIPVVVSNMGDAINPGFAAKYGQPGGNVTGMSMLNPEVAAKQLELLKQVKPKTTTVAVLLDPANPNSGLVVQALKRQADASKVALKPVEVRGPDAFEAAFSAMQKSGVDALVVQSDTMFGRHAKAIANLGIKHRIAMVGTLDIAKAGGLIGYAASREEGWRRLVGYIDKILKGAKAADLPVEQPSKIDLVINMKTAKTLGVTIPPSLLSRADEVIQ